MALVLLVATACAAGPAAAAAPSRAHPRLAGLVGVTHGTSKVRPGSPVPRSTRIELEAARNEFEPFQIVLGGGERGLAGVTARAGPLERVDGRGRIGVGHVRLHREVLYQVDRRSSLEGDRGGWPDALVPAVDAYAGERRNAFPFDVPARETRAIWVDVFIPREARPGLYAGTVTVSAAGAGEVAVSVRLRVRDFVLPPTPSLRSAFGFSVDAACRAHAGGRFCRDGAQAAPLVELYVRAALRHRVSLMTPYYTLPSGPPASWREFDRALAPFLDGVEAAELSGARLTSLKVSYRRKGDPAWERTATEEAVRHLAGRGWADRAFEYVYDEPHACVPEVPERARNARAAGLPALVTTDLDRLEGCRWADDVDVLCPLVNQLHPPGGPSLRARYDAFLARPGKALWWYQSCMSHGCKPEGTCGEEQERDAIRGYPSYVIDASAVQARAMEWLSFTYRVTGELYYDTVSRLDSAWKRNGLCDFGGQGDGTLFYPGLPEVIGGRTGVPVESIRLKLVREGMEDHQYLQLLADLSGDRRLAEAEATRVFPAAPRAAETRPEAIYEGRRRIAERIERLVRERRAR